MLPIVYSLHLLRKHVRNLFQTFKFRESLKALNGICSHTKITHSCAESQFFSFSSFILKIFWIYSFEMFTKCVLRQPPGESGGNLEYLEAVNAAFQIRKCGE